MVREYFGLATRFMFQLAAQLVVNRKYFQHMKRDVAAVPKTYEININLIYLKH